MSYVPLRQPRNEAVDVGLLGGVDDLLHGDLPRVVAVPDVLGDGAVEDVEFVAPLDLVESKAADTGDRAPLGPLEKNRYCVCDQPWWL